MHAGARIAERARARALEIGFPLAGFAPATPPPRHEFLVEWLRSGYAGEMHYLSRDPERRADPRRVLPDARSVIVVGAPYTPAARNAAGVAARGVVSAYACGEDYHHLIEERLGVLAADLEVLADDELSRLDPNEREVLLPTGELRCRSYVDHGPLLERPLGARAGLGWVGKNTLLLHRRYGSWFFLGVLLTTLDLPADEPESDHCGSCRRCLDACPTGAFPSPYVLDARRCISYLTIELRGSIPRDLRPLIGARIFGCDDCQTVCPWTPEVGSGHADPLFAPQKELAEVDLVASLEITDAEFESRYGRTPLTRTRRRGLRRNAAVALGNVGDRDAIPALERALGDDDPLVRGHAAWALGEIARRLGGDAAVRARRTLAAAKKAETEADVLGEIEAAEVQATA